MSTLEHEAHLKDGFLLSNLKNRLKLLTRTDTSLLAITGWEISLVRLAHDAMKVEGAYNDEELRATSFAALDHITHIQDNIDPNIYGRVIDAFENLRPVFETALKTSPDSIAKPVQGLLLVYGLVDEELFQDTYPLAITDNAREHTRDHRPTYPHGSKDMEDIQDGTTRGTSYGSNNDLVTDHSILESAMGKHDKQIRDHEEVNDALAALTIFEKVERTRINPYPSEFRQTYSYGKRRCVHCREADIQECVMARTLYGNTRSCDECTTIGIECSYKPNNDPSSVESKPNNQVYDLGEGSRLHETDYVQGDTVVPISYGDARDFLSCGSDHQERQALVLEVEERYYEVQRARLDLIRAKACFDAAERKYRLIASMIDDL